MPQSNPRPLNGSPHDDLLAAIVAATPSTLNSGFSDVLQSFIPRYFQSVPTLDLAELNVEDLNGAALSHMQLSQHREPSTCNLRVINPRFETDGWQSLHSVIEVIAEDQPHLVSSLRAALGRNGYAIHLIIHPVLSVSRDAGGQSLSIDILPPVDMTNSDDVVSRKESFIHIEIDRVVDSELEAIDAMLRDVLADLSIVLRDTRAMRERLRLFSTNHIDNEQAAFVAWLAERQFACMGIADIDVSCSHSIVDPNTEALGLLDPTNSKSHWTIESLIPDESLTTLNKTGDSILICKSDSRSPIIRDDHADVVLLLHRNDNEQLIRINCIVGLFVPGLQHDSTDSIPLLRERVESTIDASNTAPESHDGKAIASVLRGFPRDMLLQSSQRALLEMANGIVTLHERQQIRLFGSTDPMGRFCNCLVYIPRDTYSRELRLDIESILLSYIDGDSAEFHMRFSSESALARLHFVVRKRPPLLRNIDWNAIEERIRLAAVTWDDRLIRTLREHHDEATALALYNRYRNGFPASYREDYSARVAVADIGFIEKQLSVDSPIMSFYRHILADTGTINFKLFSDTHSVPLSDVIPIIENMGLRVESEHPFELKRHDANGVWIHEFTVQQTGHGSLDAKTAARHVQEAFSHIWRGSVENDGFNRLILAAGLNWRQVVILRSYCKYLLQIGVPFSQSYMIETLVENPTIAALLIKCFEQRFDPARESDNKDNLADSLIDALESVDSLDEDRILRAYLHLIQATLRTNLYCLDSSNNRLSYVSYKFDSAAIPDLPLPRPLVEIFVYSPHVEGIHLRGGRVARGGLRWSDRREDFRTEVLGLMKAQMVKNAVIVPVGSKGGFFVKIPPVDDRESMMQDVIACYQTFLRGLLDITDNIVANRIVPPKNVVRYDGDDPYLVVAADKGTASFSDNANTISAEYGFWLGDAFASGGSVGYDHKKMGITARGAWESVKRHFRELGHDIQQQPFSVVGIGDMGGDVFGNGMLLSRHIQLVAAFNHEHIFIDPEPNAELSFAERSRLFSLPRSSWTDYDSTIISTGGGIYSRKDKKIKLTSEAMEVLGIVQATLTPTELINHILKAPVDLLWNGGIGTYIKSSSESHNDAADRTNDALRVNATELRCKVLGEGGNLGCTQLGRVEFARAGGMIYTDAIDNSAGVDCSDYEVNIKIMLNSIVASDDMTRKQRDSLLVEMTDTVATLVLRDNYLQTQCINLQHAGGSVTLNEHARFMQHLESIDRLDRDIEFLPGYEEIADRLANNEGLSRPEIAVLVSYSKMVTYDDLLASDFADEPALQQVITNYFPSVLGERYAESIAKHRLRPEIIATVVTNDLVNRLGPTFTYRMHQELGTSARDAAAAFVAVRDIFNLPDLWAAIEALDNKVPAELQDQMQILVRGLVERAAHWLLRSRRVSNGIDVIVAQFKPGIRNLIDAMPDCLASVNRETLEQRIQFFIDAGVPEDTALAVARVVPLSSSFDILEIAASLDQSESEAATVYFELGRNLELQWLRERIGELQVTTHWHTLAKSELRSDLHYQQRHLTAEVISSSSNELSAIDRVNRWSSANSNAIEKYGELMVDMKASASVDFAMLSLAVNEVHKLLRSDRPLVSS